MRLKLHREVSVSGQLELPFEKARMRHDNDDCPFASRPGLPKYRPLSRAEVRRAAVLTRMLAARSLTMAGLETRCGPAGAECYDQ